MIPSTKASIVMKSQNGKSKYLPRILQRSEDWDKNALPPIADMEFARLPGPKVLLGAPGGGKTSVCKEVAHQLNGQFVRADDVVNGWVKEVSEPDKKILVIDGLDEVLSEGIPKSFAKIIETIRDLGYDNWLISCRVHEWRSQSFNQWIESAFGQFPEVAHLGELSDDEIKAFLKVFMDDVAAEQFFNEARRKEAKDFLNNPQTLQMLIESVQRKGWPKTKTKLFHTACEVAALEYNSFHYDKDVKRLDKKQIIDTAGWICAQLLMSGAQAIALYGRDDEKIPRPENLEDPAYPTEYIKFTCQTKLFKSAGAGRVEPVHRTVAEFLAGRWLAEQFKADPRTILPRRVMNSLTFGTEIISPSLRGLHAWITSLDVSDRLQNIKRDPYGCLRYGDLSELSNDDLIALLEELVALTQIDPFFQGSDWNARFGHSLGRASIKEKFVEIISDANTSPHLKFTLLQAIQGTELAEAMIKELKAIVLNEDDDQFVRRIAVNVLAGNLQPNDWRELAKKLLKRGTISNLRIVLDHIIRREYVHFSGTEIAEHLIAYEKKALDEEDNHISIMKYEIPIICSDIQIAEIAKLVAAKIPVDLNKYKRDLYTKLEEWLAALFPRLLKRSNKPTADELCPLILRFSNQSYKIGWKEVVPPWFAEHDDIRRELQARALDEGQDASAKRMVLFWLKDISAGLDMGESDVIHHLKRLVVAKDRLSNWQNSWEVLIWWIRGHDKFDGSALKLAKEQAADFPELKAILEEVMNPPISEHEAKSQEIERQYKEEALAEIEQRHANFSEVRESMEQGEHITALGVAAKAVLGHYPDFKQSTSPKESITDMAGQENLASVIAGFEAAVKRDDIPSVEYCTNLRVNKNKVDYLELISLAHSMLTVEAGKPLTSLPKKAQLCALSASWSDLSDKNKELSEEVRASLQDILFQDHKIKRKFVKDMIESSLEAGKGHPPGFFYFIQEEMLPDLALEWLTKFEDMNEHRLCDLLKSVIGFGDHKKDLIKLADDRLQNNTWASEGRRRTWHVAAFLLDFDYFNSIVREFANEDKDRLWTFREFASAREYGKSSALSLGIEQIAFLLETFAPQWPFFSPPSGVWSGTNNPWDATDYLRYLIRMLSGQKSKEAIECFENLVASGRMATYQNYVKHELANARQGLAETHHSAITLDDVRNILQSGKPNNVSDLQALFMEEMERYEKRIRTGQDQSYLIFWDRKEPYKENDCRDRLLGGLEERMESYNVRVHKEGAMADNTRVDLLLSCGNFDLPVEIKRQWHPDIWTAAHEQLERYTENYRTDGTGIYLVIWHGPVKGKTIPKPPIGKRPKSADEMRQALLNNSGDLSPKTKIVVLDVSIPASKKK